MKNFTYKRPAVDLPIYGLYKFTEYNGDAIYLRIIFIERNDMHHDSLTVQPSLRKTHGGMIVRNDKLTRLSKGFGVRATFSVSGIKGILKKIPSDYPKHLISHLDNIDEFYSEED